MFKNYTVVYAQPSLYPGNCWAMEGQNGHATVKLREGVVITGVTIDHIPQELSPNGTLDTAPKDFSVQVCDHRYNIKVLWITFGTLCLFIGIYLAGRGTCFTWEIHL